MWECKKYQWRVSMWSHHVFENGACILLLLHYNVKSSYPSPDPICGVPLGILFYTVMCWQSMVFYSLFIGFLKMCIFIENEEKLRCFFFCFVISESGGPSGLQLAVPHILGLGAEPGRAMESYIIYVWLIFFLILYRVDNEFLSASSCIYLSIIWIPSVKILLHYWLWPWSFLLVNNAENNRSPVNTVDPCKAPNHWKKKSLKLQKADLSWGYWPLICAKIRYLIGQYVLFNLSNWYGDFQTKKKKKIPTITLNIA